MAPEPTWKRLTKDALALLNRPPAEIRFRRRIQSEDPPYRIHIGADTVNLPGWISTDVNWRARLYLDASKPWPVPPDSVSHVYGDNVVEHFPLDVARRVFRHTLVALQPNGVLRLATPDVESIARAYLEEGQLCEAHSERHRAVGYSMTYPVDLLRVTFTESGHERGYLWDMASLSQELVAAGYDHVLRVEVGKSPDPVLQGLESRTGPTDIPTTLVVEARKPPS